MNIVLITGPTEEPVTVSEAKLHLRVDHHDEDDYIKDMIREVREDVENDTRRALMTQTWDYYLDAFPKGNAIILPFGNLQSVTHVKYTDSDGVQTAMTVTTEYLVETNGDQFGRIVLPYSVSWPSVVLHPSNPIVIRFICGWTSRALVPARYKSAIKLLLSKRYVNRGENYVGFNTVFEDPTVNNLLFSQKLWGDF